MKSNLSESAAAASDMISQAQLPLLDSQRTSHSTDDNASFPDAVKRLSWNGNATEVSVTESVWNGQSVKTETFTNEFWTSKQRAGNSLHEISYRACFKPQLVDFFVERLTANGDLVYDPFMGRGTTVVEAALLDRATAGCDVNPLSRVLVKPRLAPPTFSEVKARLHSLDLLDHGDYREDLTAFYHPDTLRDIVGLKSYFRKRRADKSLDSVDEWIEMVAVNRLTGHSPGFFSVYTMPPNQAVSIETQRKINSKRGQIPPPRDVRRLILNKTRALLRHCDDETRRRLHAHAKDTLLLTKPSHSTPEIESGSVTLVVTSPPFLDVVGYASDNWLRCWFCGIDPESVGITIARKVDEWQSAMTAVFRELHQILIPGGHVAFEVGEVRGGKVKLEEAVVPCGMVAGLEPVAIVINSQVFTKTAACWGVTNNRKGTNTNRVVVFRKPR